MFWFTSYIMLCYFITPIEAKLKEKIGRTKLFLIGTIVFVIYNTICIFSGSDTAFFYRFNYALFLYSDNLVKALAKENWSYSLNMTGVLLLTLTVRILVGRMSSSPIVEIFYTSVIAQISSYVIALWVCGFIFMIAKYLIKHNYLLKCVDFLDRSSYEMYITHGICISMVAGCFQKNMAWVLIVALAVFCTAILSAFLLHTISDPIYRKAANSIVKKIRWTH